MTKRANSIVNKEQALKILKHFPEGRRNSRLTIIYKATVDGWASEKFAEKVNDKGSNLIVVKTTKNAICGGYTSLSWTNSC